MVSLLRAMRWVNLCRGMLLVLFVSVAINTIVPAPKAAAGGVIMVGYTIITHGKDRVSGKQYQAYKGLLDPRRIFPKPSVIRVYPGDEVQFLGIAHNVDPFPIPGISQLQVHYKGLNDPLNPLNIFQYYGKNIVADRTVFSVGTGVPVVPEVSNHVLQPKKVTIDGPGSDKPGNQYCQFVSSNPTFYLGIVPIILYVEWKIPSLMELSLVEGFTTSFGRTMSCAEIAYVYNLQPSLTLNNGGGAGGPVGITTSVSQGSLPSDAPGATYSKTTQWQVSQFFLPLETTEPGSTTSKSQSPCSYFKANYGDKNMGCIIPKLSDKKTDARSGTFLFNRINTVFNKYGSVKSGTALPSALAPAENVPDGYKVCYALSLSKYKPYLTTFDAGWRNSKVVCTAGSKKPKVQILGDDIRVGGKIATSTTDISGKRFGSWGQYASYSAESTEGFATQSGFDGGMSGSNWSRLTFANIGLPYGYFASKSNVISQGATQTEPFFQARAEPNATISSPLNLSGKSNKTPYLVNSSSLTISGGNIGEGETVIIVASDATVKITGDIKYTSDALSSVKDIPQVVIIAKNINIDPDVRRIDAWLVASGTINTCFPTPAKLTIADCLNPLRVNGPLATGKLLLNRTYGSTGDDPGEPAEIFNNNGTSYLWAQNYLQNHRSLTSILQKELPPRF